MDGCCVVRRSTGWSEGWRAALLLGGAQDGVRVGRLLSLNPAHHSGTSIAPTRHSWHSRDVQKSLHPRSNAPKFGCDYREPTHSIRTPGTERERERVCIRLGEMAALALSP